MAVSAPSAVLKPQSSSKPSLLQATVPRTCGSVCHVGPGLGSKGWPHHQLWLHTFLTAGWALVTQQASASEALTMTMLCLQPSCPPRQHPHGAGASPSAVPLGRGPEGPGARAAAPTCAAHLGVSLVAAGVKPGAAGAAIWGCYASSTQLASTRSRDYFFFPFTAATSHCFYQIVKNLSLFQFC